MDGQAGFLLPNVLISVGVYTIIYSVMFMFKKTKNFEMCIQFKKKVKLFIKTI